MAKNKTTENSLSVIDFVSAISDQTKRKDCSSLIELIKNQTSYEPKMWGPSIVGFGSHHYIYESGREGDSPNIAFSPRASSIAIYLSANFDNRDVLLTQFGKHKADKGCVHIKTIADIDIEVLKKMIANHIKRVKELYPD
ncbi:MAG: DUF1801 domain-containing protein [Saprospiraceae bacterium]